MTARHRYISIASVLIAFAAHAIGQDSAAGKPAKPPAENPTGPPLVITTSEATLTRPGTLKGVSVAELLAGARPKPEKLIRKGVINFGGESFDLYLPEPPYSIENTGRDDGLYENNATRLAIDADRDGKITGEENWFANLPIRIVDQMFRVAAIAEDGARVELRPIAGPPRGLLIGRKVPEFSYTTVDGRTITHADYSGKAFLLDIWSVT